MCGKIASLRVQRDVCAKSSHTSLLVACSDKLVHPKVKPRPVVSLSSCLSRKDDTLLSFSRLFSLLLHVDHYCLSSISPPPTAPSANPTPSTSRFQCTVPTTRSHSSRLLICNLSSPAIALESLALSLGIEKYQPTVIFKHKI